MPEPRTVEIHEAVHGHNEQLAASNRALFHGFGIFTINVMSAPGSGKTEFLARTLSEKSKIKMAVVVGDIATDNDARRLCHTGAEVVQITTGGYCHLDAEMVAKAVSGMDLGGIDLLIIENVGNMVCPATFDLGEDIRVALLSVTEGEDKPLKYPTLFKRADAVVLNKIDLSEAVGFNRDEALGNIRHIAPQAGIFEVSARTGQGMPDWYAYLGSFVRIPGEP